MLSPVSSSRTARRRVIFSAAVLFTALVATPTLHAQEAGIAIGSKAPGAAVESLDGKAMDMTQFLGKKPMVVEFWATWCPLCKKLEPAMAAAKAKFGDAITFVHVGVPQNQSPERQQAYVTQQQMTGQFVFDKDGAAYKAYKATHTSYVVVVDAAGTVVYTGVGPEQDLDAAIRKALPATKGSTH
jgi:thiol-disulfide isomerase/thioredoxin